MCKKFLLLAVLPSLFLTGCWDQKDPEDREYIITLGVDSTENGCRFSFAPANQKDKAEPYTAQSVTLADAVAQVDCRSSRQTDLGQMKTIIFSKSILEEREKLYPLLEELERSQSISEKVMLLVTESSAEDCVKAVLKEDSNTGLFLWDFYKNTAQEVAVTKGTDLDTFLTEWQERAGCAVFPRISAEQEKLQLGGGIAIGNDGVYPLEDKEERGYLFLLGEAEGALLQGEYMGKTIPLEIGKSDAQYAFLENGDGKIRCTIRLPLEGALQGGGGMMLSAEQRKEVKERFEAVIKEEVLHTMEIAEQAGEDLFGILPRLYQTAPRLAQGHSREVLWESIIVEIQPEVKLTDMGRRR